MTARYNALFLLQSSRTFNMTQFIFFLTYLQNDDIYLFYRICFPGKDEVLKSHTADCFTPNSLKIKVRFDEKASLASGSISFE